MRSASHRRSLFVALFRPQLPLASNSIGGGGSRAAWEDSRDERRTALGGHTAKAAPGTQEAGRDTTQRTRGTHRPGERPRAGYTRGAGAGRLGFWFFFFQGEGGIRDEARELILKRFPADALLRRGDPTTERE